MSKWNCAGKRWLLSCVSPAGIDDRQNNNKKVAKNSAYIAPDKELKLDEKSERNELLSDYFSDGEQRIQSSSNDVKDVLDDVQNNECDKLELANENFDDVFTETEKTNPTAEAVNCNQFPNRSLSQTIFSEPNGSLPESEKFRSRESEICSQKIPASARSSTPVENKVLSEIDDTFSSRRSSFESFASTSTFPLTTDSEGYSSSKSHLYEKEEMSGRIERSPHFTLKPQSKVAEEGTTVTFQCQITGYPQPTVHWYKANRSKCRVLDSSYCC
ncbi:unnamed protein product [Clavelina lepadiformis]|uniref:Ig-like domain-containing protein n=1 Tax=Clavelina lepadiformis TaxID=159417 RepID=A0ABP0F252_CLALP